MKTLLRIDSSSRISGSYSRALADYFEEIWKKNASGGKVIYRDLVKHQIPHIHSRTIEGFYTPKENMNAELLRATALSDELIAEIKSADELLISSPLYNLTIPSSLEAYFGQVMRIGHTFNNGENGSYGLLQGIKAFIITAKGGIMKGTAMEQYDFQEPYLKAILNYMGIKVEALFSLEGTEHESVASENTQQVQQSILEYFISLQPRKVQAKLLNV